MAEKWSGVPSDPIPDESIELFCHKALAHTRITRAYDEVYGEVADCKIKSRTNCASIMYRKYRARINYLKDQAIKRVEDNVDKIISELTNIATGDPVTAACKLIDDEHIKDKLMSLTPGERGLIKGIEVISPRAGELELHVDYHDKLRALQMLGEHFGAFQVAKADANPGTQVVFNIDLSGKRRSDDDDNDVIDIEAND
jgi:hypothetical protein